MILPTKGLRIHHITFYFANAVTPFFKDISLHFARGTLHFIRGHNGSGKSTLLRILQGAIQNVEKLEGAIQLDQHMYTIVNNNVDTAYKQSVKSVVQNINAMLADSFTVRENLQLAQLSFCPGLRSLPPVILNNTMLQDVGINMEQRVDTLSGGQRQIVAVMMMLQKPTHILLLDEPTAALDSKNAHMVIACLEKLARDLELVVIIISHDKELVTCYARNQYTEIEVDSTGARHVNHIVT